MQYLKGASQVARRLAAGAATTAPPLVVPPLEAFKNLLDGSEGREISTTMAFVRILTQLLKDKNVGPHVVPIVPDEARTFGMEGLFRQVGIYSSVGQLYTPQDADQLMYYKEDRKGQMLEEGINEAGAFCSWMAAGTAYANHGINMIPMYIFYSMFGFQRIGDFAWAAGDMQARGFLLGATAGRTTLAGEGLQHQDGHSHLLASTIPNCVAYDPCFAYELAVIMQDGLRRMYAEQEKRLLLHHLHERELRAPRDAEGRRAGNPARHVPAAHRRPRRGARDAARFRHDPARGARGGGTARVRVRHPGGRLERHELHGAAARCARRRARGDAAARATSRGSPGCGNASRDGRARSSPRPTT